MSLVIGDGSGFPKRCFTWTKREGRHATLSVKWCVVWLQYPSLIWRHNPPASNPLAPVLEIEGVDRGLLRELEVIDTITWLSRRLSSTTADSLTPAITACLQRIQDRLPDGLSLLGEE